MMLMLGKRCWKWEWRKIYFIDHSCWVNLDETMTIVQLRYFGNCTAFDNGQEVTWLFWLWQLGELPCKLFKSHHCEGYFFQHLLLHFWAVTSCTLSCWLWDFTLTSYRTGLGVVVWCTRKHSQVHAVHLSSLWKSSSRNLTSRKFSSYSSQAQL